MMMTVQMADWRDHHPQSHKFQLFSCCSPTWCGIGGSIPSQHSPGMLGHPSQTQVVSTGLPLAVRKPRAAHTRHFFFDVRFRPSPSYSRLDGKWSRPVRHATLSSPDPAVVLNRGALAIIMVMQSCRKKRKSRLLPALWWSLWALNADCRSSLNRIFFHLYDLRIANSCIGLIHFLLFSMYRFCCNWTS